MKFIETKFKMIDLILKSWNISKEDRENLGIDELLKLNQELNKADFDFNENETSNIDLVKMMELGKGFAATPTKKKAFDDQYAEKLQTLITPPMTAIMKCDSNADIKSFLEALR